jgi:uncharacterized protein YjbJ (UPF0337 family)
MPDEDVIKGRLKQAEGKAQDAWGDLTDDADDDAAGKEKQVAGKVQETWGRAKDAIRDALDED